MHKFLLAFLLAAFSGLTVVAQTTTTSEYKKSEFFVGYSNNQVDTGVSPNDDFSDIVDDRESFHGFNVSGVYNFSRYFGINGDVSGTYNNKSYDFTVPTVPPATGRVRFDADSSLYNFLGGIQIKDNASEARLKPFAHILAGAGHGRVKVDNLTCDLGVDCSGFEGTTSETGFAAAFGGGLDIKLNNRIDLRAIQIDYNPIRFDNGTTHNVRFGIGLVFK
jgi:opacity protein-like surface antigen